MIVEGGYVIMFGENKNGQLGIGSVGKINKQKPVLVKNISDRFITVILNIWLWDHCRNTIK